MRLPPWFVTLLVGLLAVLAWLAFRTPASHSDSLDIELGSHDAARLGAVEAQANEPETREAASPPIEALNKDQEKVALLQFLVRDAETLQPIVGARLSHTHDLSPAKVETVTDSDGRGAFNRDDLASDHSWSFLLFAEGYQSKLIQLPGPLLPMEEVLIHADRSGTLTGVIHMPDENAVPQSCWVVAWTGTRPTAEEFAGMPLAFHESESIHPSFASFAEGTRILTRSDARGEFRFSDLAMTKEYQVLAACDGMLSRTSAPVRIDSGKPLELELLYAWGVDFIARDEHGQPLPGNGRVRLDRGNFSWSFPDGRMLLPGGTNAALPLTGLDLDYVSSFDSTPRSNRFTVTEYSKSKTAPTIRIYSQPPGFSHHQAEYELLPLGSEFRSTQLRFDRLISSFGALELEVTNSPLEADIRGAHRDSLIIAKLYPIGFPETGIDEILTFALVHPENGVQEFSGIPVGEYWLGFESANRLLNIPWKDRRLTIRESVAQATLDLGNLGALDLEMLAQVGSELPKSRGRTWIQIRGLAQDPRVYGRVMLSPGSNRISLIPAGEYEISLVRSTAISHALVPDVPVHVTIVAGEVSPAEITLAERGEN